MGQPDPPADLQAQGSRCYRLRWWRRAGPRVTPIRFRPPRPAVTQSPPILSAGRWERDEGAAPVLRIEAGIHTAPFTELPRADKGRTANTAEGRALSRVTSSSPRLCRPPLTPHTGTPPQPPTPLHLPRRSQRGGRAARASAPARPQLAAQPITTQRSSAPPPISVSAGRSEAVGRCRVPPGSPQPWRPPGCCPSSAASTSAVTTSRCGGITGGGTRLRGGRGGERVGGSALVLGGAVRPVRSPPGPEIPEVPA